jgi:NifU-like protein involved in Fe-S cluster formation
MAPTFLDRWSLVYVALAGPDHKARRLAARVAHEKPVGCKSLAFAGAGPYIGWTMLSDVYNRRILELAAHIPRIGRLDRPDATAVAHSRLCGSKVTVDLAMQGDVVSDFAHDVKACALGQASSSVMAQHVVGSSAAELRALRETARRMLKEGGDPPEGKWADLAVLLPVRDYKARHASTLLTFDAVVDAIDQIEARRAGHSAPRPA